jgi:hypothetical protein
MRPRVRFFVDGFNLYHTLAAYAKDSGDQSIKWLDLIGLTKGSLHEVGGSSELGSLHYFTAISPIACRSAFGYPAGNGCTVRLSGSDRRGG